MRNYSAVASCSSAESAFVRIRSKTVNGFTIQLTNESGGAFIDAGCNFAVFATDGNAGGFWVKDGDTLKPLDPNADVQVPSLNGGQLAGFRNKLINGDFNVWQRGAGPTAVNASGTSYLADRWAVRGTGGSGGTPTVQFQWGPNKEYSMHRYNATGLTSGSFVEQKIEASSVRPLINKQLTVSVYSSHSVAVSLYYYDSVSAFQPIDVEQAMTSEGNNRYSHTFTIPNVTIAAFGEDAGLLVRFHYNNAQSPLSNGSYDIWKAQLEPGPVATPFEHRPIGTELSLCQRYYWKAKYMMFYPTSPDATKTNRYLQFSYPTSMRIRPNVSWSAIDNAGTGINTSNSNTEYGYFTTTAADNALQTFLTNPVLEAEL